MKAQLEERFRKESITVFKQVDESLELLLIDIPLKSSVKVLMTSGLSNYDMPVHERYKGRENVELFFCLPRYWDINEKDNTNRQWPTEWLETLVKHVQKKNGWFGPGHTIQCDKEFKAISETMKQNHFIMVDPILLKEKLQPLHVGEKQIHFLGIIPIFGDEMDYKQGKGTYKLLKKFHAKGINEKLDDFRETVLISRFKFW
ncbi:MAG: suppressor of fused domain protein [Crocinitomicaceae bacterium]|nr:suppressor of fused domain protein [Crocinitomicaceae bacterium]